MSTLIDKTTAGDGVRTLNLAEGGQQGAMTSPHQWQSNANYVRQQLIAVLVAAPIAMRWVPDQKAQIAALKSLIEVMPKRIEGLNSTVTWEFAETPVGNAGEMFESVINATRERSIPAFAWDDKHGQAVAKFWNTYGHLFMMDPDLSKPGIVASQPYIDAGSPPLLPEHMTFTTLFIEPDETMTNPINAWLCTNMMPKTSGEIIGRREMAAANEVPEVSIEMTALTLTGKAVLRQAKAYLDSLQLTDLRPTELKSFTDGIDTNAQGITPDVASAAEGFSSKITDVVEDLDG